jgi:hypothetical protein
VSGRSDPLVVLTNTDPALRRCWHPVARSGEVLDPPHAVVLLGEPWVVYRSGGSVRAFADRCPHRHCPLTLGRCEGGVAEAVAFELEVLQEDLRIQEAYHALELPLSPTAEVHTRADPATPELRRVLGDLVAAVESGAP